MYDDLESAAIKKVKQGDINAFEGLVTRYEKTVYNIAYRLLNNHEDAKDVSQEAFIKIYRSIGSFNEGSTFSTWVYRITYNACIDYLRKLKNKGTVSMDFEFDTDAGTTKMEYIDTAPLPDEVILHKETAMELNEAISELSDEQKTYVVLRDIQDLSYNEISEITGASMGTVKSRIFRARNQLKKILQKRSEQKIVKSV